MKKATLLVGAFLCAICSFAQSSISQLPTELTKTTYQLVTPRGTLYYDQNVEADYLTSNCMTGRNQDVKLALGDTRAQFLVIPADSENNQFYLYCVEAGKFVNHVQNRAGLTDEPTAIAMWAHGQTATGSQAYDRSQFSYADYPFTIADEYIEGVTVNDGIHLNSINICCWDSQNPDYRWCDTSHYDDGNAFKFVEAGELDMEAYNNVRVALGLEPESVVPEDAYPVNFDKEANLTYNRSDRATTSVSIIVGGEAQTIVVEDQSVVYRDLSEQKFTVTPGAVVSPKIGYNGEWMHGYLYLDTNCNYYFDVAEDFMDENDELVSFTFYSPTDSSTGLNSAGETKSNNCNAKDLPSFTAPTKPGEYRMRYIVDWNCVDPGGQYGSNYYKNFINDNKGCIIDVTLVVEEGGSDPVVDVDREAFEPWKAQINGEFAEIAYAYGYQVPTEDVAGKKPAEVAAPVVQYWLDRTGIVQIGLPYETVVEVLASYYQTTVAADYELGQQLLAAYHAAEDVAESADYTEALAEAVEAANAALEGAYNEYVTSVGENLITRNDQFASPYTETREGSINNLIDGDQGSYWHSSWAYSVPAHTHYLQVKLDEAISGDVMATISRRLNVANDHVVLMGVEASLDGREYVTVGQLEFPYTGTPATQSATFNLAEEAKYLRFYNDQSNGSYQRGYWHISEFQLNQTCTVRDLDAPSLAYPTAVADLEAAIAAAQKLQKPTEADVEALKNAIAAYNAALAGYPEFTEWTEKVDVEAGEVRTLDDLLKVDLKFPRALDVEESDFSVLGAVIAPNGDGYAIAFGDLFGNVEINKVKADGFVGNVASVEFTKLSDLDADLRAEAKKAIAKIGGFAAAEGQAYVLFASKSFLVDGEKYNEFVKAGYDVATGTLTGIETIVVPANEISFDLQGRRANNANGIVIKNGKKVVR